MFNATTNNKLQKRIEDLLNVGTIKNVLNTVYTILNNQYI